MNKQRRLGLISDSHGNFPATEEAINILVDQGCEQVIHLGDFCDTNRRDRMEDIFRLFQERRVIAVKGNNDYLIELALSNCAAEEYSDQRWMYEFLKEIPMKVIMDNICFAHSFPFDYLRAFYEPIDVGSTERASLLFGQMPYWILFCGHSHTPVYFQLSYPDSVLRKVAPQGNKLLLEPTSRYIFVVGSADEGECAVFDAEASTYERINIRS
ncbi:MAG: metallophosphoesterase family protein [Deltaproteobacteria bacterium]|nr:metallophosphoesterase family protein [Deltaproteobacteria bacterium]